MKAGINHAQLDDLIGKAQWKDRRGLRAIGDELGLGASTISRAQNGKVVTGDNMLILLSWIKETLNVSWDEVMDRVIYDTARDALAAHRTPQANESLEQPHAHQYVPNVTTEGTCDPTPESQEG